MTLEQIIQPFSIEEDHTFSEIDYPITTEFKLWHNQKAPFGLQQLPIQTTTSPTGFRGTFCDDAMKYHGEVLHPESEHFRQGYLVRVGKNNTILGHIKKHNKPTLLAWKFSQGTNNNMATWFAGIYTLPEHIYNEVENLPKPPTGKWGEIQFDKLQLCPGRLLEENQEMYKQSTSHREHIRQELLNIHKHPEIIYRTK